MKFTVDDENGNTNELLSKVGIKAAGGQMPNAKTNQSEFSYADGCNIIFWCVDVLSFYASFPGRAINIKDETRLGIGMGFSG